MNFVNKKISEKKENVCNLIQQAQKDELKPPPGMTIRESFKSSVEQSPRRFRSICSNSEDDNNVKQMVGAGLKGSFINISQMSVWVGQQSVEDRRITFGFKHRTLPYSTNDDFSPEARGFVENSYLRVSLHKSSSTPRLDEKV